MSPETILIIDDDPDEAYLVQRKIKAAGLTNPVYIAESGHAGLEILNQIVQRFRSTGTLALPLLVLLDLKMPEVNGFEVLEKIRTTPELASLVTIVQTGSDAQSDVVMAYQLGARSYIVKPADVVDLRRIVESARLMAAPEWLRPSDFPGMRRPRARVS